jgi:hypothetical protein
MQNEHDEAVDRVLKALRDATPPEGMEARIAERLQHHASAPSLANRWRERLGGVTIAGAWWRGAFSGAATAMVAIGIAVVVAHFVQPRPHPESSAVAHSIATVAPAAPGPVVEKVVVERRSGPCATPSVFREKDATTTHKAETLLAESIEPSFPAPAMPLTTQERRLLRLAQKADPKQLGALDPEAQAKADAAGAAEFDQFFAPPPAPKIEEDPESTGNVTDKKGEL